MQLQYSAVNLVDPFFTDDAKHFLSTAIHSLEQLEILLLLHSEPRKPWTSQTVYEKIRSNETSVEKHLKEFARAGLLDHSPTANTYQFVAASTNHSALVNRIADAYKNHRIKVIELIYSPSNQQVKGFADAFKFKKET